MAAEKKKRPSRKDWVIAGLQALSDGGVESVKVERLAVDLKISKGPFYWRFADRGELLAAMLDYWKDDATTRLIEIIAPLPNPRARLERLVELVLQAKSGPIDAAQAEGALRDWASRDPAARKAAREVDARRIQHLVSELRAMGTSAELAEVLARGIYLALLGLYTARRYTPELADDEAYRQIVRMALDVAEADCEVTAS